MSEYQEYVSVAEAVKFTGKSEKTVRLLIKELLEVQEKTSVPVPEIFTEVKGDNQRQFYKISLQYLKKRFEITSVSSETSSASTSSTTSGSREEVDLLHNWLEDKQYTIENLRLEIVNKNNEIERLHQLLENQQKMTLHGQLQIEKTQLLLEEKNKSRKKVLGIF